MLRATGYASAVPRLKRTLAKPVAHALCRVWQQPNEGRVHLSLDFSPREQRFHR